MNEGLIGDPTISNTPPEGERDFEIQHHPDRDIVINSRAPQEETERLASFLSSQDPTSLPRKAAAPPNIRSVSIEGRPFIVKVRDANPEMVQIMRETSEKDWADVFTFPRQEMYAFNSIANEFSLSQEVKTVVSSAPAQEIARQYGFNDVRFIGPLVGIIRRSDGLKAVAYPDVPGSIIEPGWRGEGLAQRFSSLFLENGIKPTDLKWTQFFRDESHLYLLDIEGYIRSAPNQSLETN